MARQRKVILPALLIPLFIIGSAAPSRETAPGDIVDEASEVPEEAVFHQAIALNASGELEIVSYFLDDQYAVMGDRIIGFHKDLQASTLAALSVLGRSIDYQALGLATAEAERLKRQLAISPQLKLFSLTDKGHVGSSAPFLTLRPSPTQR